MFRWGECICLEEDNFSFQYIKENRKMRVCKRKIPGNFLFVIKLKDQLIKAIFPIYSQRSKPFPILILLISNFQLPSINPIKGPNILIFQISETSSPVILYLVSLITPSRIICMCIFERMYFFLYQNINMTPLKRHCITISLIFDLLRT